MNILKYDFNEFLMDFNRNKTIMVLEEMYKEGYIDNGSLEFLLTKYGVIKNNLIPKKDAFNYSLEYPYFDKFIEENNDNLSIDQIEYEKNVFNELKTIDATRNIDNSNPSNFAPKNDDEKSSDNIKQNEDKSSFDFDYFLNFFDGLKK